MDSGKWQQRLLSRLGRQQVTNPTGSTLINQTKGMIDSADAPGVVADGSTDVCTTFQAWIDANPGKHLWTRKVAAPTQGGNSYSTIDYYSSCTFHVKYNGTVLEGSNPDDWQGAPVFLFAKGVMGFQIDPVCMGCLIKNIEQVGGGKPAYNSSACYNSGHPENYPFTGASDGFYILGGEATLEHVQANCNSRDGIHIDGSNIVYGGFAGQPDLWRVIGGQGTGNLHDNLYTHGGDSNDGYERGFEAYNAGGWGIQDDTPYGNEHLVSFTNGNGRDVGSSAGATSTISSISCSSFTCSVVTATPVTGIHNNIWVVISSTTNYNGTFYITGYSDTQHFSFLNVAPSVATETSGSIGVEGSTHLFANAVRTVTDGACPSGQANLTSQSAQFGKDTQPGATINVAGADSSGALLTTTISQVINEYSVNLATNCLTTVTGTDVSYGGGISHGPMMSNAASVQNVWIEPNQEANQPPSKFTSANEVIGGLTSFDYTYGIPTIRTVNNTTIAHVAQFRDPADTGSTGGVQMQCGTSTQRNCGLSFFNYNQSAGWLIDQLGGSSNGLVFQIAENNGAGGIIPFRATHAGTTDVTASTDVTLNPGTTYTIKSNGNPFYQAATTAPGLVIKTSGSHYEDIYTCGANCLAIGGAATNTGIPASSIAQFSESLGVTIPLAFTASSTATFNGAATFNSSITFGGITGSTQCLHVSTLGVVSGSGADCGSGAGGGTVTHTVGALAANILAVGFGSADIETLDQLTNKYFDVPTISSAPSNPSAGYFRLFGNSTSGTMGCLDSTGANCLITNLTSNVTGTLPLANGGTGATDQRFVDATTFTLGADACADIALAGQSLNSVTRGGTVDARGFTGTQSCASNPFAGVTVPVKFLFAGATWNTTAQWNLCNACIAEGNQWSSTVVVAVTGFSTGGQAILNIGDGTNTFFDTRFIHFQADCGNTAIALCYGFQGNGIDEGAGLSYVRIRNCNAAAAGGCVKINSAPSTSNYRMESIYILFTSSASTTANGVSVTGTSSQGTWDAVTVIGAGAGTTGHAFACAGSFTGCKIRNFHFESMSDGVYFSSTSWGNVLGATGDPTNNSGAAVLHIKPLAHPTASTTPT